jgi:hypothetical protein
MQHQQVTGKSGFDADADRIAREEPALVADSEPDRGLGGKRCRNHPDGGKQREQETGKHGPPPDIGPLSSSVPADRSQ